MSNASRAELREWHRQLSIDPLDAGDERYVPLHQAGRGAVDEIMTSIEITLDATTQLISGPSGSGKTTELKRLQDNLTQAGFRVLLLDTGRYVNRAAPISITELLVALGLGASDALAAPAQAQAPALGARASFGERLRGLLGRLKVDLDLGVVSVGASAEGVQVQSFGSSVEVDLQRKLVGSQPFVEELRAKLSYHVDELFREVADFIAEMIAATEPESGSEGFVLLVDSLEKLRGTAEDDDAVQNSVQRLFVHHADKLKFPRHHTVYTVPTYLQFTSPGALSYDSRVLPVPVPYVVNRAGAVDAGAEANLAELREVVQRRIPTRRIFTGDDQLDVVVKASGGNLRDLFTLLRQLINLVMRLSLDLPVADEHVEEAIANLAHDFSQLTAEQVAFLKKAADSGGDLVPAESEVARMAMLLQSHMLLCHLNGKGDWYEVHPLARRALGI